MIRRYLREHLPLAGLLALFAGTFALVLSLYHLPTEPVAYASPKPSSTPAARRAAAATPRSARRRSTTGCAT